MRRSSRFDPLYATGTGLGVLTCLFCLVGPATAADIRLGSDVVPSFQAISLGFDAGQSSYRGSVKVDLEVKRPTDRFLHSEGHELERVALFTTDGKEFSLKHEMADSQTLAIQTETALAEGSYTLEIDFTSAFGTRAVGLYRMEQEGVAYAFTQFEPDDAREAFPCWDEQHSVKKLGTHS